MVACNTRHCTNQQVVPCAFLQVASLSCDGCKSLQAMEESIWVVPPTDMISWATEVIEGRAADSQGVSLLEAAQLRLVATGILLVTGRYHLNTVRGESTCAASA